MLRRIYLLTAAFIVATGVAAIAQTGSIKGKVLDKTTKEPLPFANVIVEINGSQAGGAQTDFDGNFTVKPLQPGRYNIKASFVGYTAAEVTGVLVSADKITFQDMMMGKGAVDITAIDVTAYKNPIIDKGNPSTQTTITQEEIKVAPTRDVKSVAATTAGVYQKDEGDDVNVRGSRSDATDYYIDGIKVRGSTNLPQSGIEQITVVTGGVPAQYGDATGGIINITTRGPSKEYFGGIEYVTSELFDKYGYNLFGGNISGPILSKKNAEGKVDRTLLGFFVSGEYQSERDPDPSAIGFYKVKQEVWDDIVAAPLASAIPGTTVFRNKADTLKAWSFEKIDAKQKVKATSYRVSGKLDYSPVQDLNLTVGGSIDHRSSRDWNYSYALFNYDNNAQRIDDTWRVFGRVTQKIGSNAATESEASSSVVKNLYYSVQVDYSKTTSILQDETNEDRYFDYGYLGNYDVIKNLKRTYGAPGTSNLINPYTGDSILYEQVALPGDSLVTYSPAGINTLTEAYVNQYFNIANGFGAPGYFQNLTQIRTNGGLRNGDRPASSEGMWIMPGFTYNGYNKNVATQFRVSAQVNGDIKDHAITAGFEYEQRTDRGFGVAPVGLWSIMRLRANENNREQDLENPIFIGNNTVHYNRKYSGDGTPGFFENVRSVLASAGYQNVGVTDFVNIDGVNKDLLTLNLFTADELLNAGNNLVAYYGYDYTGEYKTGSVSFEDFWTAKDDNGNYTRPIAAFEPIYMAGYIQDKFAINDLIFNIGVRVDRFDANQKVLRDKYLLYPAYTVGQKRGELLENDVVVPAGIGNDFVIYVNDVNSPNANSIIGYRFEDIWYDANGTIVSNPNILAQQAGGVIAPWLVSPSLAQGGVQTTAFKPSDSFKDYEPVVTVMPRVAFSFPISDEALFFAHYDVLTQRPPSRLRSNPLDYYFIESQGSLINNPALKPERTTDYEIGFKQTLSKSSAITISGFYRELRDMIQQTKVNFAFPKEYQTYDNLDFGTVKGLSLGYDLRRTGNVRLSANYTLQFADGTGSADNTSNRLLANGQPNLRTIAPLDFDQRHAITTSIDYRYGQGKDYNGPMIKNTQVLANAGLNIVLRAGSGTPYSRQRDVVPEANSLFLNNTGAGQLDGEINGSRLPWQYRVDIKLDKDFALKMGKGEGARSASLNVYIQVQNLFDTKNIISVYRYTGNPDDDGYLASAVGQDYLLSRPDAVAFVDQYNIKVNNPNNYSLPRRARIGVKFDF
ncbi:MAG: TonB-dependent receptor domain-containing protein [Bacteroidota bacterium]|jgi:outer membrane receptor protein involved in Fe transport